MARWHDKNDEDFDDSEDSESPDEADSDGDEVDTEPCPFCGEDVYEHAQRCPRCGQYIDRDLPRSSSPRWVWITAIVLLATMIFAAFFWL